MLDLLKMFYHLVVDRVKIQGNNSFKFLRFMFIYNLFLCRNSNNNLEQPTSSSTTTMSSAASPTSAPSTPQPTSKPIAATLVGTLRRKNPFNRAPINTTDFAISSTSMKEEPTSPVVPPKSTLRPTSHILQRNKIDPAEDDDEVEIIESSTNNNNRKSNKSATLSAKRLSLRLPNAFRNSNNLVLHWDLILVNKESSWICHFSKPSNNKSKEPSLLLTIQILF
jgi:hypothetical protein